MSLTQYMNKLTPGLLRQSVEWRLDRLLDPDITLDAKRQWIYDIKQVFRRLTMSEEEEIELEKEWEIETQNEWEIEKENERECEKGEAAKVLEEILCE